MTNLPKRLTIMGHAIEIKQVATLPDEDHGRCDPLAKTISISKQYPIEQRWLTLYHEAAHMVLALTGLSELLTTELEEAIVLALEHNFFLITNQIVPQLK